MNTLLKPCFLELTQKYSHSIELSEALWIEIESSHSSKNRYYHTLAHLCHMLHQLGQHKPHLHDRDALLFSLFYHDIVYNVTQRDNEILSAQLAENRLVRLSVPTETILHCTHQILATQHHEKHNDSDINIFLDLDLAILGQSSEIYADYAHKIRQEYAIYPDEMYKAGRKKVLHHFLQQHRIFKTDLFSDLYEKNARQNLATELDHINTP